MTTETLILVISASIMGGFVGYWLAELIKILIDEYKDKK